MTTPTSGRRRDRFPHAVDGDVNIVITNARQYTLHSSVLEDKSPVIRDLLYSVRPITVSRKNPKHGSNVPFRLVLVENTGTRYSIEYILEPVALDYTGRPKSSNPVGVGNNFEHGRAVIAAYDAVLGAFYNIPITIADSQENPFDHLLSSAVDITTVAEYLQCVQTMTSALEDTLQGTGQMMFRAISSNPTAWLTLAYRLRSTTIFREALIHATGQYNTQSIQRVIRDGEMPDEVVQVLQRKGQDLIHKVKMAQRHFASYYPTVLMREKVVGRADRDNIGRSSYGNDVIMWIALCVFRHWCTDQMAADKTHHAPDIGFRCIQAISDGGNAYLSRTMMQTTFHLRFPMSPKGMACVEHRLSEIKENVKQWATPLMKNASEMDIEQFPVKYFTCTNVDDADIPWEDSRGQELVDDEEDAAMDNSASAPAAPRRCNLQGDAQNEKVLEVDVTDEEAVVKPRFGETNREEAAVHKEGRAVYQAIREAHSAETRPWLKPAVKRGASTINSDDDDGNAIRAMAAMRNNIVGAASRKRQKQ